MFVWLQSGWVYLREVGMKFRESVTAVLIVFGLLSIVGTVCGFIPEIPIDEPQAVEDYPTRFGRITKAWSVKYGERLCEEEKW